LFLQFTIVISGGYVQVVFGFWFRRLEWASKNTNLGIMDFLWHLGVGHILVDQNAMNQLSIVHRSCNLEIKKYLKPPVFPLIFMSSKLTSFLFKSATVRIASVVMSARFFLKLLTTLDPKEVMAAALRN
jgi:hypothetical protein